MKIKIILGLFLLTIAKQLSAQNWGVYAEIGTNYSLSSSIKNIHESASFQYMNGFPEGVSFFPMSVGLKTTYKYSDRLYFSSGIVSNPTYYKVIFNSFVDYRAEYFVETFEYKVSSITIPVGVDYRVINKPHFSLGIEGELTLNFNKIMGYGLGGSGQRTTSDSSTIMVGVTQEILNSNRVFSLGNTIGVKFSFPKAIKRFNFKAAFNIQYAQNLKASQQVYYENITHSIEESYSSDFTISPIFFSFQIGYRMFKF